MWWSNHSAQFFSEFYNSILNNTMKWFDTMRKTFILLIANIKTCTDNHYYSQKKYDCSKFFTFISFLPVKPEKTYSLYRCRFRLSVSHSVWTLFSRLFSLWSVELIWNLVCSFKMIKIKLNPSLCINRYLSK